MTFVPPTVRRRSGPALAALFLAAFVMGSAELVVVGLLRLVAGDLEVSVDTAGTLVTAYALGICFGGPLLMALTIRIRRRTLVWMSLAGYVAGSLLAALAPGFGTLLVARAATGALQGLFLGAAFTVAAALVPPERTGRAISVVFGGIAVSTALGVPLGTLAAQHMGWRAAFTAIVLLGTLALLATVVWVPPVDGSGTGGLWSQFRHALAPRGLAVLGVGFLLMGGQFAAFTYITPFLEDVTGVSGTGLTVFLFVYGVATAVGTFAGGWAADRDAARTLVMANLALLVALATLHLAGTSRVMVALALVLWGVAGFGLVPSLQHRVVLLAGPGRDLASTLPASAVNAGIAIGAVAGGVAVSHGGATDAVLTGLLVCAVALPATWMSGRLRPAAVGSRSDPAGAGARPTL
ncbi:MFS transporter [Streptomyces alkaliphilus]|uniref:MFS transporter n=1 Tax=Streptomyces alkaliphilus TaxID=1472722 RepID=UPI00117F71A4|nr:MFS transporter [Streptomyces alkaliphilus]MQS08627.1 MFS transporter [Streptomyces alkaliphilus]